MLMEEQHPTKLYFQNEEATKNRTFNFAFCGHNKFILKTKNNVDELDLRKYPTLRGKCDIEAYAFLSEEYKVDKSPDKIFCEYSFDNP